MINKSRIDRLHKMMVRYLGPSIMEAFGNDDVTEIYVNPDDCRIRFDTRSRGKIVTENWLDQECIEMFLNTVATEKDCMFTTTKSIQAELPGPLFGGSRLQGFLPPLTSGPCFNIRKPPRTVYSLEHYVKAGLLTDQLKENLVSMIDNRQNILIIGGTNSGKTTFANALLWEITTRCPLDRIVVLEDTVELQCTAQDTIALRTIPGVSLAQLVKMTLRASPNRIVVGEVRDEAALDLLDAWATGHPGGLATFHATDANGALLRLDRLAQRANVPSQKELIAEAIHGIVVMAQGTQGRYVADLVRVNGMDTSGQFQLSSLAS